MGGKRSRGNAAFFAGQTTGRAMPKKSSQRRVRAASLLPGVVNDEQVLVYQVPTEELEHETKARITAALVASGVAVWNNPVGRGKAPSGAWMAWGLCPGSADLIGLVPPYGRFLGIETKRPKGGVEGEKQKAWIKFIRAMKGVAGFARNEAEALALADEARRLP